MRDLWKVLGLLGAVILLPACSGDSFTSAESTTTTNPDCVSGSTLPECQVTATGVSIRASKLQVKSDNSDSATLTATVLDENNAVLKNQTVAFSTPQGKLSPASIVVTDENGEATVKFSSGDINPSNQTVFITATVTGVGSASIPIDIIGTTLEITSSSTALQVASPATTVTQAITVTAENAGGQAIRNAALTFTIVTTGTATLTSSALLGTTDTSGNVSLTLTASGSGTAILTASGLGTTASTTFTVTNIAVDNPFRITAPATDPSALTADGVSTLNITVAAAGVTTVRFTTTIGTWDCSAGAPVSTALPYCDMTVSSGSATGILQAATTDQGFATVTAFNTADYSIYDSMNIAMSPPVSSAAVMLLQSDVKTLPPNTGTTTYSTTVRAQVKTDNASGNYPIYNVPVILTLANSTGGGETLSKSYATTDLNGFVTATFTSGITSTGQVGVQITATVAGAPAVNDSITIEIGGLAGSVALGTPRVIQQTETNDSINTYNMSALVADGTGAGVAGAQVTLQFWPGSYATGVWYDDDVGLDADDWRVYYTGIFINEDLDEDGILDPGEDINGDGELTPANSTAGVGPSTVTTLADGTAPFDFVYLKDFANWVNVRAKGTTRVLGTEATTTTYFTPDSVKAEVDQGLVHDSPFQLILDASLTGGAVPANALIAMYPGTTIPWRARALSTADTLSVGPGTVGVADNRTFLIPAGATAGTTLIISLSVTDSATGYSERHADFTAYVRVIP